MKQRPDIVLELPPHAGGKEKPVHRQNKHGSQSHINKPQLHGHGLLHGQRGQGNGEGGGKYGLLPGPWQGAVHKGHDHGGQGEMPLHSRKQRQRKIQQRAARHSADKAVFQAEGAVLVHGLQQKKCVEHKPVSVITAGKAAEQKAQGQHGAEAQGKTHLKGIRPEPAENPGQRPARFPGPPSYGCIREISLLQAA